jgi:two-component response regulator (ARR-B family)
MLESGYALFMLRSYRSRFDILISDLHMPGIDGFKLLQILGSEMPDLPVLVISSDDDYNTIQKGIINEACHFLVKPIPLEALKMVWKYVLCKRRMKLDQVQ